jgi:hypothetical protein
MSQMTVLKPSHSLPSVPFSSSLLGCISAYPKCLLLVKFITTDNHENKMERIEGSMLEKELEELKGDVEGTGL